MKSVMFISYSWSVCDTSIQNVAFISYSAHLKHHHSMLTKMWFHPLHRPIVGYIPCDIFMISPRSVPVKIRLASLVNHHSWGHGWAETSRDTQNWVKERSHMSCQPPCVKRDSLGISKVTTPITVCKPL